MDFNNTPPEWENDGTEPSEDIKSGGFKAGYKPPAAVFNWFWSKVSKCLSELQTKLSETNDTLDTKVDKIDGKGLTENDFTDDDKTKLDGIEAGAQVNTVTGVKGDSESSYRTGTVNITKANVGLGNVPNVTTNNQTPTYSVASTLAEITSGETLATAFGKIKKAIASLISHLADKSNPHGVTAKQVGLSADAVDFLVAIEETNPLRFSLGSAPLSDAIEESYNFLRSGDHTSNYLTLVEISDGIDSKQAAITGGASTITTSNLTASRALVSNSSGKVAVSHVTTTELGYLDGVTSNVQTQLNAKASTSTYASTSQYGVTKLANTGASTSLAPTLYNAYYLAYNGTYSGTCSTSASTAAKTSGTMGYQSFVLRTDAIAIITFTYAHTSSSAATLNVCGTGAKNMYWSTATSKTIASVNSNSWVAGDTLVLRYTGSYWYILGKLQKTNYLNHVTSDVQTQIDDITDAQDSYKTGYSYTKSSGTLVSGNSVTITIPSSSQKFTRGRVVIMGGRSAFDDSNSPTSDVTIIDISPGFTYALTGTSASTSNGKHNFTYITTGSAVSDIILGITNDTTSYVSSNAHYAQGKVVINKNSDSTVKSVVLTRTDDYTGSTAYVSYTGITVDLW